MGLQFLGTAGSSSSFQSPRPCPTMLSLCADLPVCPALPALPAPLSPSSPAQLCPELPSTSQPCFSLSRLPSPAQLCPAQLSSAQSSPILPSQPCLPSYTWDPTLLGHNALPCPAQPSGGLPHPTRLRGGPFSPRHPIPSKAIFGDIIRNSPKKPTTVDLINILL